MTLGFVEALGDWHADMIRQTRAVVEQLGLSESCAPMRSLEADRQRCGGATKIRITLSSKERLTGQVRGGGLSVSNKSLTAASVSEDRNVQSVVSAIESIDKHCKVTIG